jgi:hypothetical protein
MRSHFILLALIVVASSLVATSCMLPSMSGNITPIQGVTVTNTSAQGISSPVDGDPGVVSLPNGEFATLNVLSETKLSLAKYQPSLNVVWSQQIILPEPETSIRMVNGIYKSNGNDHPAIGTVSIAQELMLQLFVRGDRIALVSSLFGKDDSISAVVRHFDIATGKDTTTRTLHRAQLDSRLPDIAKRYNAFFSPDSSKILLYVFGRNGSDEGGLVNVTTFTADFAPIASTQIPFTLPKDQKRWPSLRIDNAGNVCMIDVTSQNTVTVTRHDLLATTSRVLSKNFPDLARSAANIGEMKAVVEPDNTLLLAFAAVSDDELAGAVLARFDFSTQGATFTRFFSTSSSLLNQKIGSKEMENPYFHSLMRVEDSRQYILLFEERGENERDYRSGFEKIKNPNAITRVYIQYTAGPVLALAFSSTGEPLWQAGFQKKQGLDEDKEYHLASFTPHVTRDGRLQVIYQEETALLLRQFQLASGKEITPKEGKPLLNMGLGSWNMRPFTTWLHDNSALVLCLQGMMSNNWVMYKVGY